jgi:hypothetical protein
MAEASERFERAFIVNVRDEDLHKLMPLLLEMPRAELHEAARTAIDAWNQDATPQVSPLFVAGQGFFVGCAAGCGGGTFLPSLTRPRCRRTSR